MTRELARTPAGGHTAAIVPAAGRGERLGSDTPKALALLDGVPLLVHCVRALARAHLVEFIVVAAPAGSVDEVYRLLAPEHDGAELLVVAGGRTRQDSVRRALHVVPDAYDEVLVHDAARPLVPTELVDRVAMTIRNGAQAAVPVLPLPDTVKRVDGDRVMETFDRETLRAVQTPQGFRRPVLEAAHLRAPAGASGSHAATDDATLVERAGAIVTVVDGAYDAFKVTRPMDLVLAEAVLARRRAREGA